MKQYRIVLVILLIFISTFLYPEEEKEIASIREIVEVKRTIVIPKDPVISALLAVQYPGLGQVYCGRYWRAAGIFVGEIALIGIGISMIGEQKEKFTYAVTDSATGEIVYLEGERIKDEERTKRDKGIGNALLLTAIGIHIWQIFDAYHQANVHNRDMIRRAKKNETGFNLKLKEDGVGIAFYKNF
ncbi:MAG: hypothetical protein E3J87_01815 [Candidatus Cloacimonadota bacterium]|nr:MAG: hypothetical protein E3J87_01815 [Candidatus Cloacimonadota bacterium]